MLDLLHVCCHCYAVNEPACRFCARCGRKVRAPAWQAWLLLGGLAVLLAVLLWLAWPGLG